MDFLLRIVFSGLTKGSIYALLALGYTMVYGIVRLINFAHGEIYMLGAFSSLLVFSVLHAIGLPLSITIMLAMLFAVLISCGYSYFMNKIAYAPLQNSPRLSVLISAIGMSIFLQNYILLAQTANFIPFPNLLPDKTLLGGLLNLQQLIILLTVIVFMTIFSLLIKYTRTGKAMRATAQDITMARLLGINVRFIITVAFVIGAAAAALGGFMIGSYVGQINFYIGFLVGIKAFVAAVLGGIGSITGAVIGSFVLGLIESLGAGYISSDYEDVFAFLFLIIILTFRPSGILGSTQKEKV